MIDFLWLVIALPLLGAVVLILFGKRIGEPGSGWLASLLVIGAFGFALVLAWPFLEGTQEPETIYLFEWIPILGVDAALLWDPLAALMTLIVTGVGAVIHLYAIGYIRGLREAVYAS